MSLSIERIGAVQPIYVPTGAPTPHAQNAAVAESVSATTAGAEAGAAAVVYEPGASDAGESYTYSNPERGAPTQPSTQGDSAVVAATGGAVRTPEPAPVETPIAAKVREIHNNVWAPVGPIGVDPAGANAAPQAGARSNPAEASAQASYAAVADAMIAGAPLVDVEKFA